MTSHPKRHLLEGKRQNTRPDPICSHGGPHFNFSGSLFRFFSNDSGMHVKNLRLCKNPLSRRWISHNLLKTLRQISKLEAFYESIKNSLNHRPLSIPPPPVPPKAPGPFRSIGPAAIGGGQFRGHLTDRIPDMAPGTPFRHEFQISKLLLFTEKMPAACPRWIT